MSEVSFQLNYQTAQLRVCINSVENGNIVGIIASQRIHTPIVFSDISDFLAKTEAVMDSQRYPQAFQRIRTFTDKQHPSVSAVESKEALTDKLTVDSYSGEVSTFLLQIVSRKNATWQGSIDWMNGESPDAFSSTLEFLKIIDDKLLRK